MTKHRVASPVDDVIGVGFSLACDVDNHVTGDVASLYCAAVTSQRLTVNSSKPHWLRLEIDFLLITLISLSPSYRSAVAPARC